ncbi:hypothetical protein GQ53DRAFT_803693 [Thozetella sp. PMI_491]|nr:hypothetical protein GQ53DRAFT_803693 [Thozetella sp. PMI_491]
MDVIATAASVISWIAAPLRALKSLKPGSDARREESSLFGTSVIYEDGEAAKIDFVFVYGLGANSSTAWGTREGPLRWPSTELARLRVPFRDVEYLATRTLLCHADMLMQLLAERRSDERRYRPIVFVVYSLGGIVVKNALISAAKNFGDEAIREVCQSTVGVVFLATPHAGSPSQLAEKMYSILHVDMHSTLYERQLAWPGGEAHDRSQHEAHGTCKDEMMPLLDVQKFSAPQTIPHGANRQDLHSDLANFRDANDKDREDIIRAVDTICQNVAESPDRVSRALRDFECQFYRPSISSVSSRPTTETKSLISTLSDHFDPLLRVDTTLSDSVTQSLDSWPLVILHGPPGSAKSSAALKYIDDKKGEYGAVVWISATNR